MAKFSKGEAIRFGWQTVKGNLGFFVVLYLVVFIVSFLPSLFQRLAGGFPFLYFLVLIAVWFLSIMINIGLIKIVLKFVDGAKGDFNDLFAGWSYFWKYLGGAILYGLIVLGGTILLIVPGVIWGIKYQYYSYLIVDKGLGPIQALKQSGQITAGSKGNLFLFGILLGLINLLGLIIFGVGLLVTAPLTSLAITFVYRKLSAPAEGVMIPMSTLPMPEVPMSQGVSV